MRGLSGVWQVPWAAYLGLALLGLVGAGYALSWHQVYCQRRRLRFVTHREQRRLQRWRTAFLVAALGTLAGAIAAFLSGLLVA
ncbi:MAG TPA: hypothetical protein VIK90_04595 [Limnochordales bacterium]